MTHRYKPLLSRAEFLNRILRNALRATGVIFVALGIGVLGYHYTVGLPWLDALLNASMILGGMGPVDPIKSDAGKLFASAYALFSGVVFISVMGVVLAPFAHRLLHRFHAEMDQ